MDHAVPPDECGQSGESSAFFFSARVRRGSPEEAAWLARLREHVGDDTFNRMQREDYLERHPRPLTDSEREVVANVIAPVLRDLELSGAIVPKVRYKARSESEPDNRKCLHALIMDGGIRSVNVRDVWVPIEQTSLADQVSELAEQVQEWEFRELSRKNRSAAWPECPEHPNSHPLRPSMDGEDSSVWYCPRSEQVISAIGALGSPG